MIRRAVLCFLKVTGLFELVNRAGGVCKSRECRGETGELRAELAALLLIQVLMQVFHWQAQESLQNGNCSEAKELCGTVLLCISAQQWEKLGSFGWNSVPGCSMTFLHVKIAGWFSLLITNKEHIEKNQRNSLSFVVTHLVETSFVLYYNTKCKEHAQLYTTQKPYFSIQLKLRCWTGLKPVQLCCCRFNWFLSVIFRVQLYFPRK